MVITTLTWNKVTVTYKKELPTAKFSRATISFDSGNKDLQISQNNFDGEKSILLAKAELINISPWNMKWKAYWWKAKLGSSKYEKLIEAEVNCEF